MEVDRLLWVNYGAILLELCRTNINYIINLSNLHKNTGYFIDIFLLYYIAMKVGSL